MAEVPDPAGARPAPLARLPAAACRGLAWFFTDIDDTLTEDGMLPADAYAALWDLWRDGLRVVPVTGRPAGWCDHIARMWPVAAVVGENGAFTYAYDRARRQMRRRGAEGAGEADRAELLRVAERVLREVPGTALAADQPFRLSDVAIDVREDVPPLPDHAVDAVCRVLGEEGVTWRVSSIHVNFWRGSFDKMSGVRALLSDMAPGEPGALDRALFIGDSPNDEPLFAGFPLSIAVANLRRFLPRLRALPAFITEAESARGFREAVDLVRARRRGETA